MHALVSVDLLWSGGRGSAGAFGVIATIRRRIFSPLRNACNCA